MDVTMHALKSLVACKRNDSRYQSNAISCTPAHLIPALVATARVRLIASFSLKRDIRLVDPCRPALVQLYNLTICRCRVHGRNRHTHVENQRAGPAAGRYDLLCDEERHYCWQCRPELSSTRYDF